MEARFLSQRLSIFWRGSYTAILFFKPDWLPALGSSFNLITCFMEIFYVCIWYFAWDLYMKIFRGQLKVAGPGSKFYSAPLILLVLRVILSFSLWIQKKKTLGTRMGTGQNLWGSRWTIDRSRNKRGGDFFEKKSGYFFSFRNNFEGKDFFQLISLVFQKKAIFEDQL